MAMYDPAAGRFNAGTVPVGTPASAGIDPTGATKGNDVVNRFDFMDSNSFTTLALAASPRYQGQMRLRLPVRYVLNHFAQSITAGGITYQGFNIVSLPTAGPNGVAWEFTGQFVVLARFIDQLYGVSEFEPNAQFYVDQIGQAQASAPFRDGRGWASSSGRGSLAPVPAGPEHALSDHPRAGRFSGLELGLLRGPGHQHAVPLGPDSLQRRGLTGWAKLWGTPRSPSLGPWARLARFP